MDLTSVGKSIISAGVILLFIGSIVLLCGKLGISIGKLPGDILIKKESSTFYFPITTCLIISLVLTAIFNFLGKK